MNRLHRPSEYDINTSQQDILTSLEKSGLSPDSTLVLGGSALAFAGIRPAGDIDVMVPGADFHKLRESFHTPSGLRLRLKSGTFRPFLETNPLYLPEDLLPIDITHPHDKVYHMASPELDEAFQHQIAEFPEVGGYRYLPPELVAAHKADRGGRKDRRDERLIRQHLQNKADTAPPAMSYL